MEKKVNSLSSNVYTSHGEILKDFFIFLKYFEFPSNKYPSIGNLSITLKGVQKLLEKINILSKRRKDARLIFFYKIINNLTQVPHEHILTKAYEGTRKKNNHKFRHIAVNTSQYKQSFFPKTVGPWNRCHSLIPLL